MRPVMTAAMFRLVGLTLAKLALLAVSLSGEELATTPPRPRLAVLVVIDQLRSDYLERWKDLFSEGGFRRLQKNGVWFQNCHYPYASTFTGPGHASLVTGCSPDKHGIVMNDWFDRLSGASVYCVASDHYHRVPSLPASVPNSQTTKKSASVSPEHLLAPTVSDTLKEATAGKARVVSLSLKDRSAILMGGRHPDICYWFETSNATVVTSSYYAEGLRPWAESFNRDAAPDRWFGKEWTRWRTDLDYAKYSGPDDAPGEGTGSGQGRTFPHAMGGGATKAGKPYYDALYNSPFGNEILLELTLKALDAERLGRGATPDLLCVSFSSSDIVGHCWGPDSQEVLDTTLRMDDVLRRLLDGLDARVGRDGYVLVLTADHGVCPLPEASRAHGKDAVRLSPALLSGKAEKFLRAKFDGEGNSARWVQGSEYPWVYLNQGLLRRRGLNPATVEQALTGWLMRQPGVRQERAGGGRAPTGSFRCSYREVFPFRAVRRCRDCHQALLLND
jgi:predicted AlkP superfamily pyrophosphatase or phosphodiesterase